MCFEGITGRCCRAAMVVFAPDVIGTCGVFGLASFDFACYLVIFASAFVVVTFGIEGVSAIGIARAVA